MKCQIRRLLDPSTSSRSRPPPFEFVFSRYTRLEKRNHSKEFVQVRHSLAIAAKKTTKTGSNLEQRSQHVSKEHTGSNLQALEPPTATDSGPRQLSALIHRIARCIVEEGAHPALLSNCGESRKPIDIAICTPSYRECFFPPNSYIVSSDI